MLQACTACRATMLENYLVFYMNLFTLHVITPSAGKENGSNAPDSCRPSRTCMQCKGTELVSGEL